MTDTPRGREEELFNLLTYFTGHLKIASPRDERAVQALREELSDTLSPEALATAKNRYFSVDSSDLYFIDAVAPAERKHLAQLAGRITSRPAEPELRVFVRDVPIRTTQMSGSIPLWAGGAAVEKTLGPFASKDGRQLWFDFFKITRLVALYFAGRQHPALLFNVSIAKRIISPDLPAVADLLTSYQLVPDSIWINAALLAANAPVDQYVGLKIRGGTVKLSAPLQLVGGKLTLAATTRADVAIDLDPASTVDSDPASAYGIDARNASMHLPTRLAFHVSGAGGGIDNLTGDIDWKVYGETDKFRWRPQTAATYEGLLNRVLVPLDCGAATFTVRDCDSPFTTLAGAAPIERGAWALPVAQIDVARPSPAAGIGGLAIRCAKGLTAQWTGLRGGAALLGHPYLLGDPGRLNVTDDHAGNVFCTQDYRLWSDDTNPHGSTVALHFTADFPFVYNTFANGNEAFLALADGHPQVDRPVTVTGQPFDIHSKRSTLIVAVNTGWKLIYLFDDNILADRYDPKQPASLSAPLALALHNALFKITPVNGFLLFGRLADDMVKVVEGVVFLTCGVYAYVPTLPDPYAANLGALRAQFERLQEYTRSRSSLQTVWLWLVAQTAWKPAPPAADAVEVSFHFAPLQNQFDIAQSVTNDTRTASAPYSQAAPMVASGTALRPQPFVEFFDPDRAAAGMVQAESTSQADAAFAAQARFTPDYQKFWDERFAFFQNDAFALLDVSSNANQMGVSFAWFGERQMTMVRTHQAVTIDESAAAANAFPLQLRGLDVVAQSKFVRAFTTPIISWEPVINLTAPEKGKQDPPVPLNYYPDDGGPTKIVNNSARLVPISPIPVCESLVTAYKQEPGNLTAAHFTLPFGMRALAFLWKTHAGQPEKPSLEFNAPAFQNDLTGGIQLRLTAGSGFNSKEGDLFRGFTLQLNNVLNYDGTRTDATTLGEDVSKIFNREFFQSFPTLETQRGVPLTGIDISGYGASTFSNWINEGAKFAETSQARFDVLMGRTAHEVIQVRTIVYPFGIHFVRTITLFRVGSGYVYRVDSGWKAESDGVFDFRFKYVPDVTKPDDEADVAPYIIHPGTVKGLFNVQNIRTAVADVSPFLSSMDITAFYELNPTINKPTKYMGGPSPVPVDLQPVYFDADVELESVVQGQVAGPRVPCKKILGFVQLAPRGIPLTPAAFRALLDRQFGSIGGPIDCIMDIGRSGQKFRVNRLDVNAAMDAAGTTPVFVAASRGNAVLPKDGSWSMVTHARGTGAVTPLPDTVSVPLIRIGQLTDKMTYPDTGLLRIANPADLLRAPAADTVNFGFLQSTNTQKVLFLTPAFAKQASDTVPGMLLSKTPPLFVDAYRLVGSKAVFPNIGNGDTTTGSAIALTKNFAPGALTDGGKAVLQLLSISSADGVTRLKDDGYKLLNAVKKFDLPAGPWHLIDEDYLKIYVEYKATTQNADMAASQNRTGHLDFDVDSFAPAVGDRWKSRVNNMAMVVDLAGFPRLVTIKGNFDAKKGSEAGFLGDPGDPVNFPAPQLELSDALEKAKAILQILAALQGGDYVEAFKRGLKVAMSNGADSWEYRLEASQEIPVLKFPPGPFANDPNAPLKLEASLKFGVYFNSALTTAALSDPKKLLPTAGAFVEFYGRLSVMCVSLSIATVYAVGQVNLRIGGDTKVGPSVDMKFGFGAQIVVGLPVVGNVSVLYMIGVEIYADATKLRVSAFLLFQGHAELIGGLVSITITIEAKGTVERIGDQTACAAQVTFGIDISIFLVINISFSTSWEEQRQIA